MSAVIGDFSELLLIYNNRLTSSKSESCGPVIVTVVTGVVLAC
jgi:hypothetical protein